jgi:hypothetical protein
MRVLLSNCALKISRRLETLSRMVSKRDPQYLCKRSPGQRGESRGFSVPDAGNLVMERENPSRLQR